jgi:hypothetical protein
MPDHYIQARDIRNAFPVTEPRRAISLTRDIPAELKWIVEQPGNVNHDSFLLLKLKIAAKRVLADLAKRGLREVLKAAGLESCPTLR